MPTWHHRTRPTPTSLDVMDGSDENFSRLPTHCSPLLLFLGPAATFFFVVKLKSKSGQNVGLFLGSLYSSPTDSIFIERKKKNKDSLSAEKVTPVFSLPCLGWEKESTCFPSTFRTVFPRNQTHPKRAFSDSPMCICVSFHSHLSLIQLASLTSDYNKTHLKVPNAFSYFSAATVCTTKPLPLLIRPFPSVSASSRFIQTTRFVSIYIERLSIFLFSLLLVIFGVSFRVLCFLDRNFVLFLR